MSLELSGEVASVGVARLGGDFSGRNAVGKQRLGQARPQLLELAGERYGAPLGPPTLAGWGGVAEQDVDRRVPSQARSARKRPLPASDSSRASYEALRGLLRSPVRYNGHVKVELLYFDGCPNHDALLLRLRELLAVAGARSEVELRRIESADVAERERFLGSPTVRVNGEDVDPGAAERRDFGLKCRLFATPEGLRGAPADEWVLAAVRRAAGSGAGG